MDKAGTSSSSIAFCEAEIREGSQEVRGVTISMNENNQIELRSRMSNVVIANPDSSIFKVNEIFYKRVMETLN